MKSTGKENKKLYDTIMDDYASNKNRSELHRKNLIEHLKSNNQKDIVLKQQTGELVPLT